MQDYELTGQASQSDIADGADESDGRWQTYYAGGLTSTQPNRITSNGSGANASFAGGGVVFESGSNGDWGVLSAGGLIQSDGGSAFLTGRNPQSLIIKATFASSVSISNLTADMYIGVMKYSLSPDINTNVAVFDPKTDQVVVEEGSNNLSTTISYPTIKNEYHTYTVLVDYAGNYINAGETGFYIDGDPRDGSQPVATLAATPNADNRQFGLGYVSNGDFNRMLSSYLEVSERI